MVGLVATVFYVRADPMEYDMQQLRNKADRARRRDRGSRRLAEDITGYVGADGMAILVDRPDQVAPLREALYRRRDAAPADKKPFKDVHALQDFVPRDQAAKIPILLAHQGQRVLRARTKRHHLRRPTGSSSRTSSRPTISKPFGIDDLPVGIARAFTETDGTRGRIVYISPTAADDGRRRALPLPLGRLATARPRSPTAASSAARAAR